MKNLWLTLLLTACSSGEYMMGAEDMASAFEEESAFPSLRIDVYPVSDTENLLPQSFSIDPELEDVTDLRFDLADTVELSGFIHGTTIYPHSDGVSVPSTRAAIEAQMEELRTLLDSQDVSAIERQTKRLSQITDAFAARRLDSTVKAALAGRRLNDIED